MTSYASSLEPLTTPLAKIERSSARFRKPLGGSVGAELTNGQSGAEQRRSDLGQRHLVLERHDRKKKFLMSFAREFSQLEAPRLVASQGGRSLYSCWKSKPAIFRSYEEDPTAFHWTARVGHRRARCFPGPRAPPGPRPGAATTAGIATCGATGSAASRSHSASLGPSCSLSWAVPAGF